MENIDIEERKPIWILLSKLYLYNKREEINYKELVEAMIKSPFSFEEIESINKYEVFPVLHSYLNREACEPDFFEENSLFASILDFLNNKSNFEKAQTELTYFAYKWTQSIQWVTFARKYNELKDEVANK
ncbi:DUF7079 family protein [Aureibacter tunicatorum]|uniref:DUF7079 domain-containing protein n=1 Tax=Aureibacter tunicatorum TaxID=866807 RepID=A0AAE3XM59_9BACT|nr:hypothetical protein [Aureibacter tunicatorum]MDR6238499.1 hypothetical protein [Aureibacter tunicatorum]BDD05568.1 hypothetical protein AUTU_30510 [Aureibacter tunicatorum]